MKSRVGCSTQRAVEQRRRGKQQSDSTILQRIECASEKKSKVRCFSFELVYFFLITETYQKINQYINFKMSKNKQEKRVKQLYLINIESHLVGLLEVLADNKLLIVSGTIISVEDCLDKIKQNIKSAVELSNDDFLSFVFSQAALTQGRLAKYQKEIETLKQQLEATHRQALKENEDNLIEENILFTPSQNQQQSITKMRFRSYEQESIEDLKMTINQLKQNQISLKEEIGNKQKQARKHKSLATDLKVEVESLNELIKRLEGENNKYTARLYESTQNLETVRRQNEVLKNKIMTFSIKQAEQNMQQLTQKKDVVLIENQNQRLKKEITFQKQQIKYLEIKCEDAADTREEEVMQLKSLAEERLKQMNRMKIKISSIQQASVDLASENEQLGKLLNQANGTITILEQKCHELERELYTNAIANDQIKISALQQLKIQNEFLQRQIFQKNQKAANLEKIVYDKVERNQSFQNLKLQNQSLRNQAQKIKAENKMLLQNTKAKFSDMVQTLKQKHGKKQQLFKKALAKLQTKFRKVQQLRNSIKQQLRSKNYEALLHFQTFIKQQLLSYKQKYLSYKKMNQERQYQRHLELLKQIDMMRQDVETKHIRVSEQQNRVMDTLKRENMRILDKTLLRVKSQDYFIPTQPSYVNRF